jgi:STE24 endopeptidase
VGMRHGVSQWETKQIHGLAPGQRAAFGEQVGQVPLTWAAAAAVLATRVGPTQEAALKPAWSTALRVTGTAAGEVKLYVQSTRVLNACAAGGRSIAVTSRVVEEYATGRLPEDQLVAVLVHELGHHATGATRPLWFVSWPARADAGVLVVVVVGLAVAVPRAVQHGQRHGGGVLVFVGLVGVLCPLADAAISRQAEYAADRFAADHGAAIELATAIRRLNDGHRAPCGWSRLLSSHLTCEQQIGALQTAAVHLGVWRRT